MHLLIKSLYLRFKTNKENNTIELKHYDKKNYIFNRGGADAADNDGLDRDNVGANDVHI